MDCAVRFCIYKNIRCRHKRCVNLFRLSQVRLDRLLDTEEISMRICRPNSIAIILSLLRLSHPLLLGSATAVATAMVVFLNQSANAQGAQDHYKLGYDKVELGDYQGGITEYSKAIEIDPNYAAAYANRAFAKGISGDHQGAIADYNKAIVIDPQNAQSYQGRGIEKILLGNKKGACEDWNRALSLGNKNTVRMFEEMDLAWCINKSGVNLSTINRSLSEQSRDSISYYNNGVDKAMKGDYQGAINDFDLALSLNPKFADAYMNRGTAKKKLGDYKGAISDLNTTIEINPSDPIAYTNRCDAKRSIGDYRGAIADCSSAIVIDPRHLNAFYNRGLAKIKSGDIQGAIIDYTKVVEFDPTDSGAYHSRAVAKGLLKDSQGMCSDLKKASSLGNHNASTLLLDLKKACQ